VILGGREATTRHHRHALAVEGIASHRGLDAPPGRLQESVEEGQVGLVNLAVLELALKRTSDLLALDGDLSAVLTVFPLCDRFVALSIQR
jgi:hypothetical protein